MADQPPPQDPGFQARLEALEGHEASRDIPSPINPLQAQTAFESRARWEDFTAHMIAVILTGGFFMLAFAALLGYVDLSNSAAATFLGTVMGYAVGKIDPILTRYFLARRAPSSEQPPSQPSSPAASG